MRGRAVILMFAAVGFFVGLRAATAGPVPCAKVISRINHEVGAERGRSPDLSRLAKALGTTPAWVEHCMVTYGRRPKRPGFESAETREERLEAMEDSEPEEKAPEDVQEPGAREREEHVGKARSKTKLRPTPTPNFFGGE